MDEWVEKLKTTSPDQEKAIVELGKILHARVARAFANQPKVDSAFVDDVVQDSLTAILDSIHQFRGKSQFLTWATTLAVRTALREMRRQRWKDTSLDQVLSKNPASVESMKSTTGQGSPVAKVSSAQLLETMYRIINEVLTEKQRDVLLAHLQGMPQAEIGRRMGATRNAVYKLGFDARKRLKEELIKAGYDAEDLETFEAAR